MYSLAARNVRIVSRTWFGCAPYPTKSPRQMIRSKRLRRTCFMTAFSAAAFAWRSLMTSARTSSPPCSSASPRRVEKSLRQLEDETLHHFVRRLLFANFDRHVRHFVVTEARRIQL